MAEMTTMIWYLVYHPRCLSAAPRPFGPWGMHNTQQKSFRGPSETFDADENKDNFQELMQLMDFDKP